eukprot:COSAG02_NODE_60591_length_271_cov_0.552326_1_plen_48_part_01
MEAKETELAQAAERNPFAIPSPSPCAPPAPPVTSILAAEEGVPPEGAD